jgi:hypothetical protein
MLYTEAPAGICVFLYVYHFGSWNVVLIFFLGLYISHFICFVHWILLKVSPQIAINAHS